MIATLTHAFFAGWFFWCSTLKQHPILQWACLIWSAVNGGIALALLVNLGGMV